MKRHRSGASTVQAMQGMGNAGAERTCYACGKRTVMVSQYETARERTVNLCDSCMRSNQGRAKAEMKMCGGDIDMVANLYNRIPNGIVDLIKRYGRNMFKEGFEESYVWSIGFDSMVDNLVLSNNPDIHSYNWYTQDDTRCKCIDPLKALEAGSMFVKGYGEYKYPEEFDCDRISVATIKEFVSKTKQMTDAVDKLHENSFLNPDFVSDDQRHELKRIMGIDN